MEKSELIKSNDKSIDSIKKKSIDRKLIVLFITVVIAFFLAVGVYFFMEKTAKVVNEKKIGESISTLAEESFVFKTIKGQSFQIDASPQSFKIPKLQNRIVFIKVFGWNCQYCRKEIPELIKLKNQFDGAFDVIAIESQHHSRKENQKFVKELGINYHIVTGNEYQRFFDYLKEHHGWSGVIPLSIVIGEDGKILAFEIGVKSYTLAELLKVSLQQYKIVRKLKNKEQK